MNALQEKTLIIINPQNDYVEEKGTMFNPNAKDILNHIIQLLERKSDIAHVIVAIENHPEKYCGFISEGGDDPVHCIENTWGNKIPKRLKAAIKPFKNRIVNFGEIENQEELSVASYSEHIDNMLVMKTTTDYAVIHDSDILICSLGPIKYVKHTIADLLKCKNVNIQICENCITDIDDSFMNMIKENNISTYKF